MTKTIKTDIIEPNSFNGIKPTKKGYIPYDWRQVKLGDIALFSKGKGVSKNDTKPDGITPCIRYGELYTKYEEVIEEVHSFTDLTDNELIFSVGNDVIIPASGETALDIATASCVLKEGIALGGDLNIIRTNENGIFLSYYLNTIKKNDIARLAQGISVIHIYPSQLKLLKLALPPRPEQQKIVSILSDWDKAIKNTQTLIKKLELRKKGLMQQLLTGKTRLAGFSEKWKKVSISEIAKQFTDKNKKDDEIEVLSCTKYDGLVRSLDYFGRKVFGDDLSKYKIVPKGYFAYATNHIEEGSIGFQDLMERGLVSPMYTVFKTDDSINDSFMFRLLKTDRMIYNYQSNMSGSIARRGGLRWNVFETIIVKIPSKVEQNYIADFFDKIDEEITQTENYLEQLQFQKKGLMQQLLTGKTRIKI